MTIMFVEPLLTFKRRLFVTVNHNILLEKIEYYGICGLANDWLNSSLKNHQQYVLFKDFLRASKQSHGVPQGSTLDPLFRLYINDLH